MATIVNNVAGMFNSKGFSLSPKTKLTGLLAVGIAIIAYEVYSQLKVLGARSTSPRQDTTVLRDGPRRFEYVTTDKVSEYGVTTEEILLEYRGGTPDQANQEFREAMADAIRIFSKNKHQLVSQNLPDISFNKLKVLWSSVPAEKISHGYLMDLHIDPRPNYYKLHITVRGNLYDEQWKDISTNLCAWRKAFSVPEDRFMEYRSFL